MKKSESRNTRRTHQCFRMTAIIAASIVLVCGSSVLAGYSVLWDVSHGVYLDSQPSGKFQPLVQNLASEGFTVDSTNQGFLVDDPAGYDVLVVARSSSYDSFYSAAEVARITDFVSAGGGLLILGDNPSIANHVQPVASVFGVSLGVSDIVPYDTYTSNLAPHPIFNGVSQICMRAAGEISAVAPSSEVAWQEGTGKALVAVGEYGNGRVVVLGDQNIWEESSYYDLVDNRLFSVNTFQYLAIPEPATLLLAGLGAIALRFKKR